MEIAKALETLTIYIVPALLGIILHEVAHGYVAYRHGDPTAKVLGRLTINPLPHIDPMGLLVFVLTSVSGSFVFGWAKPVPVDTRYFAEPKKAMMLVAFAGPAMNFVLALCFAFLLWVGLKVVPEQFWLANQQFLAILFACKAGIVINLGLAWLNLIPIPPLDGSKILAFFLSNKQAQIYMSLERYGFLILLLLLFLGILNKILTP
ncbi:MAG: site-2 protease family protein, partial [Desulfovibrio sp.]|nr:site-2 protease family protein [Desulfovibrio sp.]